MTDYPSATWYPATNFGYPKGASGRQGRSVVAVVMHVAEGYESGCDLVFTQPDGVSAQYLAKRNGGIKQYVLERDACWGAGILNKPDLTIPWLKRCVEQETNVNLVTISIECEGFARDPLTEAQYQSLLELLVAIFRRHKLDPRDLNTLVGHCRLDTVNRANDPGPHFPWARLRADLIRQVEASMTDDEERKLLDHFDLLWGEANVVDSLAKSLRGMADDADAAVRVIRERVIAAKELLKLNG